MVENHPKSEITLKGQVQRVTYVDPDSGFTIAQIQPIGNGGQITVVGNLMAPAPGTLLKLTGRWTEHEKFGRQFKVARFEATVPASTEGIERYLGSGLIKGIGPTMASRMVACFGKKTLEVIEHHPQRLTEVPGVGDKKAQAIRNAWQAQRDAHNAMLFLQSHGVSSTYASKIYRHYGHNTIQAVRHNPYALADDIFGIGFLSADAIATKMGMANDDPLRLQAGIRYQLNRLADEGHLYYPHDVLVKKAQSLLKTQRETVTAALRVLAVEKKIVIETLAQGDSTESADSQAVFLAKFHGCESFIAQRLGQIMEAHPVRPKPSTQLAMEWVQQRLKLKLDRDQHHAVAGALTNKVMVITGGPGTGKTTIVRAITQIYRRQHARVLLAAPTGRAAKRLSEATGRNAQTIHRMLEYHPRQGGFNRNRHHPLDADMLVIDEVSMIDAVLMYHLLQAVALDTRVILVGDVNQLPSVGPGNLLKDIIASGTIPQVTLRQIFRQARESRIVTNAHRINAGRLPDISPAPKDAVTDFYFIHQEDPQKILETIIKLVSERIPRRFGLDPLEDIQVLTPMHRGVVGAQNLNVQLQQALNPQEAYISRGDQRFSPRDKVMQLRNNYDKQVFNGDIGRISRIDPREKKVVIQHDNRAVDYAFEEMEEITLAYAVSVHKSQGSEYPAVVIPVTTQHYLLLQRNLIYTAVTRAKQLVVLVGTQRALAMAVKNNASQKRYTRLAHRMAAAIRPLDKK